MLTRRAILCPVDFSEQSRQALQWATMLAARDRSRLIVLTVIDPMLAETARARLSLDLEAATRQSLQEFVRTTRPDGILSDDCRVLDVRTGDVANAIIDASVEYSADLTVLGTHGLGGFRKWLLGSTTARVLARTHAPVLGVPPAAGRPAIPASGDTPIQSVRVLAATDFGDSSASAITWASDFAERFDLPLLLAHVVEPITVPPQWQSYVRDADEDRVREARLTLDRMAREACRTRACETVVSLGRPDESIASIAKERDANLIVVGLATTHAVTARHPGSVAYNIMRMSRVPTLVVPDSSFADD